MSIHQGLDEPEPLPKCIPRLQAAARDARKEYSELSSKGLAEQLRKAEAAAAGLQAKVAQEQQRAREAGTKAAADADAAAKQLKATKVGRLRPPAIATDPASALEGGTPAIVCSFARGTKGVSSCRGAAQGHAGGAHPSTTLITRSMADSTILPETKTLTLTLNPSRDQNPYPNIKPFQRPSPYPDPNPKPEP